MATPIPKTPRIVHGNGEDLECAMLWLEATLAPLPPRVRDRQLRSAPAMAVLLSYRQAVLTAPEA